MEKATHPHILLLNTYYSGGGAAVAARRLLEGLRSAGYDARLLVASPLPPEAPDYVSTVYSWRQKAAFYTERAELFHSLRYNRTHLFRFSPATYGIDISRHPWIEWADVLHLHWLQQGFLSASGLEKILNLEGKKLLWSLHDLWPITGGCHVPYFVGTDGGTHFCTHYLHHCGNCPLLGSKGVQDQSYDLHERKSEWPLSRVHFLGVSEYVTHQVRLSSLTAGCAVDCLPNMIDPRLFHPVVPHRTSGRRTILFVAARPDDPVKGLDMCREVLERACYISEHFEREADFVCIGRPKSKSALANWPIPVRNIPVVTPEELVAHYREATLTLSTSRFETFGQTLLESIACGTPALAFNVGGISDIIRPQTGNGILIEPYDLDAMAHQLVLLSEAHRTQPSPSDISATVAHLHTSRVIDTYLSIIQ